MQKNKILQNLLVMFLCGLLFYILGEPCRDFFKISETTEIRVTSPLPFLYTIVFGLPGVLGSAFGNTIADIKQGFPATMYIPGFFFQILYGVLPAMLWKYWRKKDSNIFKLDRVYKVAQFMLLALVYSALISCGVLFLIWVNGFPTSFTLWDNVFFNQLIAMLGLGMPLMVGISLRYQNYLRKKKDVRFGGVFSFSLNEKFLLFFVLGAIFIGVVVGGAAYQIMVYKRHMDAIEVWNVAFYVTGIVMNFTLWVSLAFLYYMEKNVTRPVEAMSSIASIFGEQTEIDEKIAYIVKRCQKYVYFTSEVGDLARSFKSMSDELDNYVKGLTAAAAAQQKTHTELSIATAIQEASLPKLIQSDRLSLYAMMDPALEVGGDFYDFFKIDDNHVALLIADVSGKGVPAALFMMVSKIILRYNLKSGLTPAQVFERANNDLCANNAVDMFVTCFCGVLDLNTGNFKFANAGHEHPVIKRKDGTFAMADIKSGFVLGGMPGIRYTDFDIKLEPGDIMFTYTDGVPEATNETDVQFGNDRMIACLNENAKVSVEDICKNMREAVRAHAGAAAQFDDITMLAFSLKEHGAKSSNFGVNKDCIAPVQDFIAAWAEQNEVPMKFATKLAVCTDEVVSNVVFYSGARNLGVTCDKKLNSATGEYEISVRFTDDGKPFDPVTDAKEPDITAPAEEREIGGLGIFMVKKMMDSVLYQRVCGKNILTIKTSIK